MLQEVNTTEISLRSKNGTTLWTRASPCLPTPEDEAFPLQVLTPPLTRELAQMPEVIQIEATGLGGKDLGVIGHGTFPSERTLKDKISMGLH